jgi:ATP-dependent exoDNAse (exonuclease V) beta subunit
LGIQEYEEVEETVASNTMGTIVHDTLEALYTPYIDVEITNQHLSLMESNIEGLVQSFFKKHFNNNTTLTGKNRLIFEVSKRYVQRYLEEERKIIATQTLKIIALEKKLETTISIDGFDFPIKIKGIVDRIDELNGVTRIIDYKTGMVKGSELKITDFTTITEGYSYSKAIQVLLYAFLYQQNTANPSFVEGGIISFKNLKNGFLKMNFSQKRGAEDVKITPEKLDDFMEQIKILIKEIFNSEVPFVEKDNC